MNLAEAREILAGLELPRGDWALHGSGPLLAAGLVGEVGDLDIVARGAAWRRACDLGAPVRRETDRLVSPRPLVEIWDGWLGEPIAPLIDGAEVHSGIPCVPLAEVLAFKRRMARPKDARHIELLERYLSRRGGGPA